MILGTALAALFVACVAARFGVARTLGAGLAFVVGDLLRIRRAHAEAALARAGIAEPRRVASAMYRNLGRGLFELLGMSVRHERDLLAVRVPVETIAELRADGRGAVVAAAHTGNWDLAACAVAAHAPLTVVTKRLSVGLLDRLWQGARRARGVRLVAAGGAARAVADALRRGELVAMLVDQAPERTRAVIRVSFLGAPALVDLAPALVALRARVPLVAAFPVRDTDGGHSVDIAAVIAAPARPSRRWAEEAMIEVTAKLEAHVRRYPEQWLWMHRRWKGGGERGMANEREVAERSILSGHQKLTAERPKPIGARSGGASRLAREAFAGSFGVDRNRWSGVTDWALGARMVALDEHAEHERAAGAALLDCAAGHRLPDGGEGA